MGIVNNLGYSSATYYSWEEGQPLYVGTSGGNVYRSRIYFNAPSPITSSSKLVVTASIQELSSPKGMIAVLSDTYYEPSALYDSNNAKPAITGLATSLALVSDGGAQAGVNISSGDIYFTFNYTGFVSGKQYYIYFIKYWNDGYNGTGYNNFNVTKVDLTYTSYTKCTAPTSVNVDASIVKPNGTVTISWSGAKSGVSNNIAGYSIGRKESNNSIIELGQITSSSGSGSYSYNVGNITRGSKLTFVVKTIGAQSGQGSNYSSASANITINSLPSAPTSSAGNLILSTTGTTKIKVTPGADIDTSQQKTIWYATSATGTKSELKDGALSIGETDINKGEEQAYFFWTYDGLEYSNLYNSITIKRNKKPIISVGVSGNVLDSENTVSGFNYIISPTLTFKNENTTFGSKNEYSWHIKYGANPDLSVSSWKSGKTTNNTYIYNDIRELIGHRCYYQFEVIKYDGYDYSDPVETDVYYITDLPKITNIYNCADSSSISPQSYFSKVIRFQLQYDQGFEKADIKYNDNLKRDVILKKVGNSWQYDFDVSSLNHSTSYTFNIIPKSVNYNNGMLAKKDSAVLNVLTKINNWGADGTITWNSKINPFVCGDGNNLIIRNFFGSCSNIDTFLNRYGFTSSPVYSLFVNNKFWNYVSSEYISNDQSAITLTGKNIYDIAVNIAGLDTLSSNQSMNLKISTTNNFGDTINWTMTKKVDFVEEAEPEISIILETFEEGWVEVFKENVALAYKIKVKSYHGAPTSFLVEGINSGKTFFSTNIIGDWVLDPDVEEEQILGNKSPIYYQFYKSVGVIGPQNESLLGNSNFNTVFNFQTGNSISSNKEIPFVVARHVIPSFSLDVAELPTDGTVTIKIIENDLGYDNYKNDTVNKVSSEKINYYFEWYDVDSEKWKSKDIIPASIEENGLYQIGVFNTLFGAKDYVLARLRVETQVSAKAGEEVLSTFVSSKTGYSQTVTIYNLKPTISYRKNKIGINYTYPEDNTITEPILVIAEHTGAKKIYMIHESINRTIDLTTGELTNFIVKVDCGSWD